jgi:homoserine kinase
MHDYIVEPVRSILIPGYSDVKESAMSIGALGAGISGSGPSIFALSKKRKTAEEIGESMKNIYTKIKIDCEIYISEINQFGPKIL